MEIECRALLGVRSTVNHNNQRVLGSRGHSQRFREERLDLVFVVVADEGERLSGCDLLAGEHTGIERG